MTDERQDDAIVSARYRELANETTPAHLDDKVLRAAANRAAHPGWSRSMRWTRPMAWAATIALCLAITLQVSRGPGTDMPAVETAFEDRGFAAPKLEQAQPLPAAAPAAKDSEARLLNRQVADEPRREANRPQETGRAQLNFTDSAARKRQDSDAVEFEVKEAEALQRAENLALLQSGSSAEEGILRGCPAQSRKTPESWLECIAAFEDSGDFDAAAREKERFIEVFPDFKIP